MPTSPRELLSLAVSVRAAHPGAEPALRCAVSRAYYAALHRVDAVFEQRDPKARINGESSHAEIISRATVYGKGLNAGRESARTIAQYLNGMRSLRNRADYGIAQDFPPQDCDRVMMRAEEVLALCDDVLRKREQATGDLSSVVPPEVPPSGDRPAIKRVK